MWTFAEDIASATRPSGGSWEPWQVDPLTRKVDYLRDIRAPLVVLADDRDDAIVPVDESRRLWAALAGRPGAHYTELGMFQHMDHTKPRVSPLVFIRELLKFYLLVYPVFRQATNA